MDSFFPMVDGVTMVMDNYAKRLIKYANVIVFVPEYVNQKYDDSKLPYKVVRCKSLDIPFLDYEMPIPKLDKNFKDQLKDYDLDIVHIHSPFMMGELGISYARKHNIPVVATMHSQFKQDFKRAVKSDKMATALNKIPIHTFNKCDECWAVNAEVARIFHEDYGYKTKPKVMNNATEMLPVKDIEKAKNVINEKHNILPDEKVLLFVGRINGENAGVYASEVMYLAANLLTGQTEYERISNPDDYRNTQLKLKGIKKISSIRNTNPLAYSYMIRSIKLLNENGLYTEGVL